MAVLPEEAGLRLDQFLAAATGLSRRRAKKVAGEGLILRNGKPQRVVSRTVDLGDVIDLLPGAEAGASPTGPAAPAEAGSTPRPELPPLEIAYEDDWLLAAVKPSGVLSQPAETRQSGELAFDEQVLLTLALREGRPPFLRLVHRIDRVTSGLLLFAKKEAALKPLAAAWRSGAVERVYTALVEGRPTWTETTIDAPIAKAPGDHWRFEVPFRPGEGKSAVTHVRVADGDSELPEGITKIEARLTTGRTHQVRVHLAHAGHPVAGDRLYGAHLDSYPRPMLHAAELALPHPKNGKKVVIRAAEPGEFGTPSL